LFGFQHFLLRWKGFRDKNNLGNRWSKAFVMSFIIINVSFKILLNWIKEKLNAIRYLILIKQIIRKLICLLFRNLFIFIYIFELFRIHYSSIFFKFNTLSLFFQFFIFISSRTLKELVCRTPYVLACIR